MNHAEGVLARHGLKYSGLNRKHTPTRERSHKPGSIDDKTRVYLTPEGVRSLRDAGRERHHGKTYSTGLLQASDFVRAQQSADAYISNVSIERTPTTHYTPYLGFAPNGWDASDARIPPYVKGSVAERKKHLHTLFETFFFRREKDHEGKLLVISELAGRYFESLAEGLTALKGMYRKDNNLLWAQFTHAPNIDIYVLHASGALKVLPKHRKAEIDESMMADPVEMGEFFSLEAFNLDSPNPHIEIDLRGKVRGYTLDDLVRIKEDYLSHARK